MPDSPDKKPPRPNHRILVLDSGRALEPKNSLERIEIIEVSYRNNSYDKNPSQGGCPPILKTAEDRLFFILFYFKTYPLQEILAYSFEMSQSEANKLVHVLSYVLKMALQKTGSMPPRLPDEMLEKLETEDPQDFAMDGTEREIVRPSDNQVQRFFYSGKSKCHAVKNNLIAGVDDRQIKGLSGTHEGKKHDKKMVLWDFAWLATH